MAGIPLTEKTLFRAFLSNDERVVDAALVPIFTAVQTKLAYNVEIFDERLTEMLEQPGDVRLIAKKFLLFSTIGNPITHESVLGDVLPKERSVRLESFLRHIEDATEDVGLDDFGIEGYVKFCVRKFRTI